MNGPAPFSPLPTAQVPGFEERSTMHPRLPCSWVSAPGFGFAASALAGSTAASATRAAKASSERPRAVTSAIFRVADDADPDSQPRVDSGVAGIVLRLQSYRRDPELVDGRVGNSAVQAAPAAGAFDAERRRRDRVGPLDRVAALIERAPG